ncbi:MAG: DUF5777 family beta-barrel protein [Bacteroidota bacterium]
MKNNNLASKWLILFSLLLVSQVIWAQDELLNTLEKQATPQGPAYVSGTFKSTRLINGHTIEMRNSQVLEFVISHRFGTLNSGAYQFFGLDQAYIRLGLDYGITNRLNVGIGRSSSQKVVDGFVKYKVLRQSNGEKVMPVSLVLFASMAYSAENSADPAENRPTVERLTYVYQALVARKISQRISLQLMPTLIHRNFAKIITGPTNLFALGVGGRYKLTKRTALSAEYYYRFLPKETPGSYNSLAIGFDIETGGHVFQLHLTNSQGMIEKAFVTETKGDFFKGDIHLGFNISRSFNLGKKKVVPGSPW